MENKEEVKKVEVDEVLIVQVLQYLQTKPLSEVNIIYNALLSEVQPQFNKE